MPRMAENEAWPSLPLEHWQDTCATLHLWTQIVGKIRLAQTPWVNHSWHVPLYVTVRGLTTSPIPHGARTFAIDFDFLDHRLLVRVSDGSERALPLRAQSVADFHAELMATLQELGLAVTIHGRPNEIAEAIPFAQDRQHASYDAEYANRFWRVLVQSDRVLQQFRAPFLGKCSPVHFFWGSFDLAVTRFSGRPAPPHPGGVPNLPDWVAREAYSHEVSSAGFWTGGGPHPFPLFYSYVYPEPDGFDGAAVQPEGAFLQRRSAGVCAALRVMRQAAAPEETLLSFLQSSYQSAADLGGWDRAALERRDD